MATGEFKLSRLQRPKLPLRLKRLLTHTFGFSNRGTKTNALKQKKIQFNSSKFSNKVKKALVRKKKLLIFFCSFSNVVYRWAIPIFNCTGVQTFLELIFFGEKELIPSRKVNRLHFPS